MLGHCFPIWLDFNGGKGVATFFGCVLATSWPVGLASMAVWLLTAALFKMSSLAALVAAIFAPILACILGYHSVAIMTLFLAFLIFIRHKDNIKRIAAGAESRIGQKG